MTTTTQKQYASLFNILKTKIVKHDLEWIKHHPDETFKMITSFIKTNGEKYNITSQKNFITAILTSFKNDNGEIPTELFAFYKEYVEITRQLKEIIQNTVDLNKPTTRQLNGVIEWSKVVDKRNELAKNEYGSRRHLLLSMYTYLKPVRQDFNAIRIYNKTPRDKNKIDGNYIILNNKTKLLVLNEYKTLDEYGKFTITLPDELVQIIKFSLNKYPREYLFTTIDDNKPYLPNSFTYFSNNTLKDLFNKPSICVTMLRHSYISSLDFNKLTDAEKKQIAREMGHSINQQSQYRHI